MVLYANGCKGKGCSDNDLFVLGTLDAYTPRDFCLVIHWGYQTQHRLMWVKYTFCFGSYVLSFILALVYSVKQAYTYERLDAEQTTMMDYAAHIWDLPKESGSAKVEDELQTFLGTRSGENVAGVSVCWDTTSSSVDFFHEAEHDEHCSSSREEPLEQASKNPIRKVFDSVDSLLCSEPGDAADSYASRADLVQALREQPALAMPSWSLRRRLLATGRWGLHSTLMGLLSRAAKFSWKLLLMSPGRCCGKTFALRMRSCLCAC